MRSSTYFRSAIAIDPEYADAHYHLDILLETQGGLPLPQCGRAEGARAQCPLPLRRYIGPIYDTRQRQPQPPEEETTYICPFIQPF